MTGPKYLSVREHLRRRVSALPEHTLLPPEPVLCEEYGVSRITLRRAVDGLVADGHLVREQGRGTYVSRPAIRHEYRESFVHRIAGWSSVMTEQGAQVGTAVLTQRIVPVQPPVAAELELLQRRMRLIYLAIVLDVVCALFVGMLIVIAFVDAFLEANLSRLVALLFVAAMLAFIGSLAVFLREIFLAIAMPSRSAARQAR